jgi:hypothetical protein
MWLSGGGPPTRAANCVKKKRFSSNTGEGLTEFTILWDETVGFFHPKPRGCEGTIRDPRGCFSPNCCGLNAVVFTDSFPRRSDMRHLKQYKKN